MKKHAENIGFPDNRKTAVYRVYILVLVSAMLWLSLIFAAPFLSQRGPAERIWAGLIRFFFAPACHQIQARSFICFHSPLAVCARCTGLAAGFMAGLLVFPLIRRMGSDQAPPLRVLGAGLLPAAAEWIGSHVFGAPSSNALRSLSGGVAGAVAVFWVLPGVFQLAGFPPVSPGISKVDYSKGRRWKNQPAN